MMAELTILAAYGSVVEDEGQLFVGFAQGEDADEPYVLFRQSLAGGPVWLEITDETFGADDATEAVRFDPGGFDITVRAQKVSALGYLRHIRVDIPADCDGAPEAVAALRRMVG